MTKKLVKQRNRSTSTFAIATPKVRQIILPKREEINQPPTDFLAYTTLLYGGKGKGKTTASSTFPDCLNIAFEPRRRNIALRMYAINGGVTATDIIKNRKEDSNYLDPWTEFCCVIEMALADPTIRTIAIDTVDILYECCQEFVCAEKGLANPSDKSDGGNTWNQLKYLFIAALRAIIDRDDKALLLISHAKERDQEFMDGVDSMSLVGPSCSNACLKILKQVCDFWFFYGVDDSKRCLTLRDYERNVDVSCGHGFLDANGEEITKLYIPNRVDAFYNTLNEAYQGTQPKPVKKRLAKKLPPRKI